MFENKYIFIGRMCVFFLNLQFSCVVLKHINLLNKTNNYYG